MTVHLAKPNMLRTVCNEWIHHDSTDNTGNLCLMCEYWLRKGTVQVPTVKELQELYPGTEWRYMGVRPTVKHALYANRYSGSRIHSNSNAVCGRSPVWYSDWYGTGNQDEYETLDVLRECKKCIKDLEADKRDAERRRAAEPYVLTPQTDVPGDADESSTECG